MQSGWNVRNVINQMSWPFQIKMNAIMRIVFGLLVMTAVIWAPCSEYNRQRMAYLCCNGQVCTEERGRLFCVVDTQGHCPTESFVPSTTSGSSHNRSDVWAGVTCLGLMFGAVFIMVMWHNRHWIVQRCANHRW